MLFPRDFHMFYDMIIKFMILMYKLEISYRACMYQKRNENERKIGDATPEKKKKNHEYFVNSIGRP